MTKLYSRTVPLNTDIVDAFCVLQKGFTDQFVYYDKERPIRYLGLGRCIALATLGEADVVSQDAGFAPVFFSFNRFDAENPKAADDMMTAFPRLRLMLPELVLIQNEQGSFLQVNSLGPVYQGRVDRFVRHAEEAKPRTRRTMAYSLQRDSFDEWQCIMDMGLARIASGKIEKLVPSRRIELKAEQPFSSKDVLVNLIDGSARGTVFLYRYGDVFFCGCTPELLLRKKGAHVESMCLAGTCPHGETPEEQKTLADELLASEKNRREHEYVVKFMREVFARNCYNVDIPATPQIKVLKHVQHLHTPAAAQVMEGTTLMALPASCIPPRRFPALQ